VTVKVNAVIYFRVVDPTKAVMEVAHFLYATTQLAQTTLRSVLRQAELDELLSQRDAINLRLQEVLDQHTGPWGVKATLVGMKQVDLPEQMIRAIARQAGKGITAFELITSVVSQRQLEYLPASYKAWVFWLLCCEPF
jgi:regulator of protease activity HflC (stomatin/prohibitin superfamily)